MLDLICVSSVLIVCSSLLFTWREEGIKESHSVPCRAPAEQPHPTPGPGHLPELAEKTRMNPRLETCWKTGREPEGLLLKEPVCAVSRQAVEPDSRLCQAQGVPAPPAAWLLLPGVFGYF